MIDNPENVNWLLQFAIEWYADHPGQQIPEDEWESQVNCAWDHCDLWKIELGAVVIESVPSRVVPGLAAICLGLSSEVLLEVIKHHDIQCDHLNACNYSLRDVENEAPSLSDKSLFSLDEWNVTKAFVDAMCLDDQYVGILENHLTSEESADTEMACLLSSVQDLWPCTALSKHVAMIAAGTMDEAEFLPRSTTSIEMFKESHVPLESMTGDEILTLLERSGNLTLGVNNESGYPRFHQFFTTLFKESRHCTRYGLITDAINCVEDPIRLAAITERLLEVLPNMSTDETHFREIQQLLDKNRYGSVTSSMVIKLNMLPISDLQLQHELRTEPSQSSPLNEFFRPEETLKMLQDELIQLDPAHFRKHHFDAISIFATNWRVPQNMEGVDISQLLVHILSGFESYARQFHCDKWSLNTDEFVELATDAVGQLSQMISKLGNVDYSRFSVLSSKSQSLLASHGFEIKKMPGISNHDRGALLSDALGL
jgi:hypothetical protein